jgi:hypothetical protein
MSGSCTGGTTCAGHSGHHNVSTRGTDELTPPEAAIAVPRYREIDRLVRRPLRLFDHHETTPHKHHFRVATASLIAVAEENGDPLM